MVVVTLGSSVRSYAAAIERRKLANSEVAVDVEAFYEHKVALSSSGPISMTSCEHWPPTPNSPMVRLKRVPTLTGGWSADGAADFGDKKRSFASKYSHFHVPGLS